jgi:hypothetical protein
VFGYDRLAPLKAEVSEIETKAGGALFGLSYSNDEDDHT